MAKKSFKNLGHIKSQYPLDDIVRDYLFVVQFELPEILKEYLGEFGESGQGVSQLTMTCREASMPGVQNSPISSFWMGMEQFFSGKSTPTTTSVQFGFEEFEGIVELDGDKKLLSPRQLFMAWSALAHDIHKTGIGVEKKDLIGTVTVTPLNINLEESDLGSVTLKSAWCESYQDVSLGTNNQDAIKSQVSIKFDYFTPNKSDVNVSFDLVEILNHD